MSNMEKKDDNLQNFVKDHWFKIGVLAICLFIAWIAYDALVAQPQRALEAEEVRIAAELAKEEEKEENLAICLEESEFQRETAHLTLCADPNIGRVPASCGAVFGGTNNYSEVMENYERAFPDKLPPLSDFVTEDSLAIEAVDDFLAARNEIISPFFEACNCGLEKYRRDDLDSQREKRDELCLQKYGD